LQDGDARVYRCPQWVGDEDVGAMGAEVSVGLLDAVDILKLVHKLCYMGDLSGKGGGAEKASRSS